MAGGFASAASIYAAGILKNSIGFEGMLLWVGAAAVVAAVVMAGVAGQMFSKERTTKVV